ncbi:hypothetical protein CPB84DRAFT_1782651 [Gymnopilus junonius]|uniref:Uncharacterized protein n=1 Tax=Gymnopilus junonius TaxID=109634 RepID=A0A9P5NIA1_GYMJU|nr:hypothetical protein CPB84DRAFT_1782651 [Gymnopilus junonius]
MASRVRRKPFFTYKSPTAEDHSIITLPFPLPRDSQVAAKPTSMASSSTSVHTSRIKDKQHTKHRRQPMTPSLPLFHPFGQLAMSLPPLDPIEHGLPVPSVPDDQDNRSGARARRPAAKSLETEEDLLSAAVSTIVAQDVRERASPRRRRAGGAKRKRRDADDGDATYPAKRTRIPRGGGGQAVDNDVAERGPSTERASVPEVFSDLNDTSKRRSTRAKTSVKRRNSSSSETTSISPSANGMNKADAIVSSTTEPKEKLDVTDQLPIENDDKAEKEEGELSEEHNS